MNPTSSQLEELRIREELHVRRCIASDYYWLTEGTATEDEQNVEDPVRPFPKREYFKLILKVLAEEPTIFIEKSRTMMMTWLTCGRAAHHGFTHPFTGIVFHSKDEDRALHCVKCVKALWRHSDPALRLRWKPTKPPDDQPYDKFLMANGSRFLAIPGDPDKIRSAHPTEVLIDEAAFLSDFFASFDTAAATRCLKLVALSSANPGGFREATRDAKPCQWPS